MVLVAKLAIIDMVTTSMVTEAVTGMAMVTARQPMARPLMATK